MKLFRMGVVVAFLLTLVFANVAAGQSLTSGDIAGRITDPAGAVVPNATVNLKSLDTGTEQTATSNAEGTFRFSLLKPGHYELSTAIAGFAKVVRRVTVEVGTSTSVDFRLEISKQAETIEVTSEAPLISTDPTGSATNFTPTEVALLPSPGNDLTTIAFTAPGVVIANGTGYGNFSANGLPGTSNLFTVNGENDMDPYFNINNSGATNLTLGANEVEEVTVTTNPYAGQYGQLVGAQVSYVTKSGTNTFHGNAQYWWNGRYMNANNWFNNALGGAAAGAPRPFSNANQWAGGIGGPIVKDKLFFFFDTEGLRFILPAQANVTIPTPAFASAVLANIQAVQPNQLPAYQTMMGLYAAAAQGKTPNTSISQVAECVPGVVPGWTTTGGCAESITTAPSTLAHEWIIASRIDYKLTSKDDIFFRFKIDHGLQPTAVDALSPTFNALSNQPAYDYQVQEHHVFSGTMANEFTATLSHYVAQFVYADPAKVEATFPYGTSNLAANVPFTNVNGVAPDFPQGRNITQYQFIDNFTWTKGKHNLQFGVNFRRYDVSDHNFFWNSPLVYFRNIGTGPLASGLADYANGIAFQYRRSDNLASDVPVARWGIGIYGSDSWKVTPTFTLTAALRVERNSNPVCQIDCFANFSGSFSQLASVQAAAAGNDPGALAYNQDISAGLHQAYHGVDRLVWSPRLAFSWAPGSRDKFPYFPGGGKTVISGGIGIFYDNPAAGLVDNLLANPPVSVNFRIRPPTGTYGFDPTATGSAATFAAASQAFNISKSYNQIEQDLANINVVFPAPAFNSINGTVHAPQAQEWNLKVEQQITSTTALTVNYSGNHVIRLPFDNSYYNATDCSGLFAAVPGVNSACLGAGYGVVPNYGVVSVYQSGAVANYNGVSFSLREQYHSWFLGHLNYTYSHTLDELSNGGLFAFSSAQIPLEQNNPLSLRAGNYGNADYDIRHLVNADWVISPQFHFQNKFAKTFVGGWQFAGKMLWRKGLPFTVVDGNLNGIFYDGGGTIFANQISTAAQTSCGKSAATAYNVGAGGCLNAAAFTNTGDPSFAGYTAWPSQARNQFRGPGYVNFDLSLFKTFSIKEKANLGIGLTAFNAFNHPNFGQPDNNLGDSTFGQISSMQTTPTSPYGAFFGFDSSPRIVQLTAKLTF